MPGRDESWPSQYWRQMQLSRFNNERLRRDTGGAYVHDGAETAARVGNAGQVLRWRCAQLYWTQVHSTAALVLAPATAGLRLVLAAGGREPPLDFDWIWTRAMPMDIVVIETYLFIYCFFFAESFVIFGGLSCRHILSVFRFQLKKLPLLLIYSNLIIYSFICLDHLGFS